MEIDVYADVVCPWCYIGTHRLKQALESYDGEVTVRLRPFELDPSPLPEPRPLLEALAEKFGGADRVRQMVDRVTGVAADAGLKLDFGRAIAANSFDAHRLVWYAGRRELGPRMSEALYRAHFTEGVDIGSRAALAGVAAGVGLDESEVSGFLDSDAGAAEVRAAVAESHQLGVTSVPTFVLAGKYAIAGAQEVATLHAALAEVTRRESAS